MLSQELLDMLRCPLDPNTRLEMGDGGLVCQRCRLVFPIRNEIPSMVVEEAKLPEGCKKITDLPCQKQPKGGEPK